MTEPLLDPHGQAILDTTGDPLYAPDPGLGPEPAAGAPVGSLAMPIITTR